MDDLFTIHAAENNAESQLHLENNQDHFVNQCENVLALLKSGVRLTVKEAIIKYNIGHLPRRIKDLRDAGNIIQDRFIPGERSKEYFI